MARPFGTRRIIATILATAIAFLLSRYIISREIDIDAVKLVLLSTFIAAVASKWLHSSGGDSLLRRLGL